MIKTPPIISVVALSLALAGCASGPACQGGTVRAHDPIITTPRVSGATTGQGSRASGSMTIGNRTTPGRVHINARGSSDGVKASPSFRSRYINWSFR